MRYGIAVGAVGVAAVVRAYMAPLVEGRFEYPTFYPAVVIATVLGGWRLGVLALALSAAAAQLWVLPGESPRGTLVQSIGIGLFVFVGLLLVGLCEGLLRTRRRWQSTAEADRRTAEALRESEQRYQILAEVAPAGIFHTNADGNCVYVNKRWCEQTGLSAAAAKERGWMDAVHPEHRELVQRRWREAGERQGTFRAEFRLLRPDGSTRWVFSQGTPVRSDAGQIVGYVGTMTDITERKRDEAELKHAKDIAENHLGQLQAVVNAMSEGLIIGNVAGQILTMNPAALQMHGYTTVEQCRRSIEQYGELYEIAYLDGRPMPLSEWPFTRAMRGETYTNYEVRVRRRETGKVWIGSFGGTLVRNRAGQTLGVMVTVRDTTQHRAAEEKIRASEEGLRLALRTSRMETWDWDLRTNRMVWSDGVEQLLGVPDRSFDGTYDAFLDRIHPQDRPTLDRVITRALAGEREHEFEARIVTPAGIVRWISGAADVVRDDNKQPVRMIGTILDVTDRRLAEQAVRESEAMFRRLADSNMIGIIICSPEGTITYANDAFLAMVGHERHDVAAGRLRWHDMTPPEYAAADREAMEQLCRTGVCPPYEKQCLRKDGTRVPILIGAAVLAPGATRDLAETSDEVISQRGITAFVADLSRQKQSEAELKNAKEAAEAANRAKDQFLAVLSHELRTPLTPVLLTVSMLEQDSVLPERFREDLIAIRRNVELEARLIDDLLDLTRIARGKLVLTSEMVDCHIVVRQAIDVCLSDASIQTKLELTARRHHVRGDAARLQQVFWNLLSNAKKFTPPGGGITVRSYNTPEGRLAIEVTDTGIGIEPEVLPRIFNAFEQGNAARARRLGGLGLGLAISQALVGAHEGSLIAHSEGTGKGSTFTVDLPTVAFRAPIPEPTSTCDGNGADRPSLRVLLVEDHESTRKVFAKLLGALGHDAMTAESVGSALDVASRERIDLVISDLGLPDGTGHDLMRELRHRYQVPGIAVSGYGMEDDLRKSSEAGFADHLTKPIDLNKLRTAIARVTDSVIRLDGSKRAESAKEG